MSESIDGELHDKVTTFIGNSLQHSFKSILFLCENNYRRDTAYDDAADLQQELYLKISKNFLKPKKVLINVDENKIAKMLYESKKGREKKEKYIENTDLVSSQAKLIELETYNSLGKNILISINPYLSKYKMKKKDEELNPPILFIDKINIYPILIDNQLNTPNSLQINVKPIQLIIMHNARLMALDRFSKKKSFWERNIQRFSYDKEGKLDESSFYSDHRPENKPDKEKKNEKTKKTPLRIKEANVEIVKRLALPEIELIEKIDDKKKAEKARAYIDKNLKPKHREILKYYILGFKGKEIAEQTGESHGNVRRILPNILKKINRNNQG